MLTDDATDDDDHDDGVGALLCDVAGDTVMLAAVAVSFCFALFCFDFWLWRQRVSAIRRLVFLPGPVSSPDD